jgi:DNA polymerase III subunit beta
MNIIAPKKQLQSALDRAAAIAERKGTMPALSCVVLSASGDRLTVSATDLRQGIRCSLAATVKKPGSIAVNAHDLRDRVKHMPGEVKLEVKADRLHVIGVGSSRRFVLSTVSADDMPKLPGSPKEWQTLPAATLASLISAAKISVSTDESRPVVCSALLESSPGKLRMASTDGHRMTMIDLESDITIRAVIPLKPLLEIGKLAETIAGSVGVAVEGPCFFLRSEGEEYSAKLTGELFPPYQQVIPDRSGTPATVNREALSEAVKAVAVAADSKNQAIDLTLTEGSIRLRCETPEGGEAADDVAAEYSGNELTYGVNARYVSELLSVLETESIELHTGDELAPLLFFAGNVTAVIMPTRKWCHG